MSGNNTNVTLRADWGQPVYVWGLYWKPVDPEGTDSLP